MNNTSPSQAEFEANTEFQDVVILGAGISGIGSAHYLKSRLPEKSFVILDQMDTIGGTWAIHKYPGARSDSDLFTFGYDFKPWKGKPIATRNQILSYLEEVVREDQLEPHFRFNHHVIAISWCSEEGLWTVDAKVGGTRPARFKTPFLWMCQGYYRHSEGYTPEWPGMDQFRGKIVHPQHWPEDLNYDGKRVVVIGSGATAATLVPALAGKCKHVTMLQRSPTYFSTGRNADALCDELRTLGIDDAWIHEIMRRKIVHDRDLLRERARKEPEAVVKQLLNGVQKAVGPDFKIDPHFTPRYLPLQQRVAFVPDGDLFQAIREGLASVVTDEIDTFTETGIKLKSGEELEADIIVTATGFQLSPLGDVAIKVDGETVNWADTITYRGMMFTGIPNLLWVRGYSYYSWTLRVGLIGDVVCRLLEYMRDNDVKRIMPRLRDEDADLSIGPWTDPKDFNPGYLMRSLHLLPKAGNKPEWRHSQDYSFESKTFPKISFDDPIFDVQYDEEKRGQKVVKLRHG